MEILALTFLQRVRYHILSEMIQGRVPTTKYEIIRQLSITSTFRIISYAIASLESEIGI